MARVNERDVPPHDLDAEMSVLGSILLDPRSIDEVVEFLNPEDFYRETHGTIFRASLEMYRDGVAIDNVTLAEKLQQMGMLERVGGRAFLASMQSAVPTSANIAFYGQIVRDRAVRRGLIRAAVDMTKESYDTQREVEDIVSEAQSSLFGIVENASDNHAVPVESVLGEVMDTYNKRAPGQIIGLSTGFADLDRRLNGLRKGEVYIIAARPAMGKTSWALQVARHAASQGVIPIVFSLEMSTEQIVTRLLCQEAKVDNQRFERNELTKEEWERVMTAAGPLADATIIVDDSARMDEFKLLHRVRVTQKRYPSVGLIIIDYLQLLEARHSQPDNRVAEVTAISRAMKAMAKDLDLPILAVSQLNRAPEARKGDHRPMMSDLRESGAIEQDAAAVAFLYRPDYYDPKTKPNTCEIIISKNRFGPTGTVDLYFRKEMTRFENMAKI